MKYALSIRITACLLFGLSMFVACGSDGKPGSANLKKLSVSSINSQFVENQTSGRLFVISGLCINSSASGRRNIIVTGKLYTRGRKPFASESAYVGNVLSDDNLQKQPIETIKERLNLKVPENVVPAGGQDFFMIAFSNLPPLDTLDEFVVDVTDASTVQ